MNLSKNRLREIIKEELDHSNVVKELHSTEVGNLRDPVSADPDALANNIKIASRVLEELVGNELAELAGVTDKLADAAQILRDVLDGMSVDQPNRLAMPDPPGQQARYAGPQVN
tara:strand:+ start:2335 stop:2676 length:342 start_codon:yes stop_codon:yes gene_type:complete